MHIDEILPGVAVVIFNDDQKVLLQKRADVGLWGLPSGHVEPGETVSNAAVREVFEETGLNIKLTRLIGVYSDPKSQIFAYPNGPTVHFVTICFQGKVMGGEICYDSPETLDLRYFHPRQLPTNILPMHPYWLTDALEQTKIPFVR